MEFFNDFDIALEDLALAGALAEELADERREWERLKRRMESNLDDESDDCLGSDCHTSENYDLSP